MVIAPRRAAVFVAIGLIDLAGTSSFSPAANAGVCNPETVGVDTSLAEDYVGTLLGESAGETFLAMDTLIKSITVWRREGGGTTDSSYRAMKLWITRIDSYRRPDTYPGGILLEGPTLVIGGAPRSRTKVQYSFDPPFQLPAPGRYAFFVQEPCSFPFDLLVHSSSDAYPHGKLWSTSRANFNPGCRISFPFDYGPNDDLIFEIEFCKTSTTPVLPTTWGRLKAIYR